MVEGRYTPELKAFCDEIINNNMDEGFIDSLIKEITYDKLKEMFPDLEEIPREEWSDYYITVTEPSSEKGVYDFERCTINLYREPLSILQEMQRDDENIDEDYYLVFYQGDRHYVGDTLFSGEIYHDASLFFSKERKRII